MNYCRNAGISNSVLGLGLLWGGKLASGFPVGTSYETLLAQTIHADIYKTYFVFYNCGSTIINTR